MSGLLPRRDPITFDTQTVRHQRIPVRPHAQGAATPLRLRHSAGALTDGAGLLLQRQLWDRLQLGARLDQYVDQHAPAVGGRYRPSTMVETWLALLLYGGSAMDDLAHLDARGVARLFGWTRVPDATTFGRWLRRGGTAMADALDQLTWYLVRARWAAVGTPAAVTLLLDSTVVQRYGTQQAGAVPGYNPVRHGRPSHHPLLAFTDTGDCLGVQWRPGDAHTAEGAAAWIRTLVGRLRQAKVAHITVRLDKGFFSRAMVETLTALGVDFVLKVPDHPYVRRALAPWRQSAKDPRYWTSTGTLYDAHLASVERRDPAPAEDGARPQTALALATATHTHVAHVLTNRTDRHALTTWRTYNAGTLVEQRIKELYQLGFGATAVDDLGGNALLAALTTLAYQVLHVLRTTALTGGWRRAQPARLRAWVLRVPAVQTTHARKRYVQLRRDEPLRQRLLAALRTLGALPPPRTRLLALA